MRIFSYIISVSEFILNLFKIIHKMTEDPVLLGINLLRSELKEPHQRTYINKYQRTNFIDLTLKEREDNRLIRAELNSRDGKTIEIHDQVNISKEKGIFGNLLR